MFFASEGLMVVVVVVVSTVVERSCCPRLQCRFAVRAMMAEALW